MGLRRLVVEIDPSSVNVTEFCRQHGISTWFFWDLRRRFARDGDVVLEPRSRAPRRVANKTPLEIEDTIVATRKALIDAGLDAGPASIAFQLRDLEGLPSESTIWRILTARGFIVAEPAKAPKGAGRSFTAARANESWGLDDTSWALADGVVVKVFNVIDDHSRLDVVSVALASMTGEAALTAMACAAETLGWPARILSDNARAFRDTLADALGLMGIAAVHTRPYHPQTNGKVERFHQTLKRWLTRQPRARTLSELQAQLDCFRFIYNHQRPHRALDRRHPADVWANAPKDGPADHPLGQPTKTYTGTVRSGRLKAGRYDISLGVAHDNRTGLAIITGPHCHVFTNGHLARQFTIDPTSTAQTLHNRPGRPRRLP